MHLEPLAQLVTREIGKPIAEARGEVQEIVDTCNFFVGEGRRLYGHTVPSEMADKQLFTFRNPVGVAAIITAGNFPVAVPAWYLVPAILCGNAVVWKPAEYSPALGDAMVKIFHAGGVPGGVLNLVQADGATTFAGLEQALDKGLVDKVGFTGSSAVGSKIGELCGRHLQSPCLELGGKNPMVIMDDADIALAVEGALFGGFGTAGQRCTSLGTAIVHESIHDEFVSTIWPSNWPKPNAGATSCVRRVCARSVRRSSAGWHCSASSGSPTGPRSSPSSTRRTSGPEPSPNACGMWSDR